VPGYDAGSAADILKCRRHFYFHSSDHEYLQARLALRSDTTSQHVAMRYEMDDGIFHRAVQYKRD